MTFYRLLSSLVIIISEWRVLAGELSVSDPAEIKNRSRIDFTLRSYAVAVSSDVPLLDMFDAKDKAFLLPHIHRHVDVDYPGESRAIPPSNWAKYSVDGHTYGLFTYKTLHRCNNMGKRDDRFTFDQLNIHSITRKGRSGNEKEARQGTLLFLTRVAAGPVRHIHTLATRVGELYAVHQMANVTVSHNTESDVRAVPIPPSCRAIIQARLVQDTEYRASMSPNEEPAEPHVVLTGSYMHPGSFWRESQFLAVATVDKRTGSLVPLKSWRLDDKVGFAKKRTQKNWLAFFTETEPRGDSTASGCRLMLSTRFAPQPLVQEFIQWDTPSRSLVLFDAEEPSSTRFISNSPTPGVTTRYFLRGSAPPVRHPRLKEGYLMGCLHVKGRLKVYRTLLYVMEDTAPFNIVSFSGLFVFEPFRNIEFVSSLFVTTDAEGEPLLQLTHGSSDCEPRIASYPMSRMRVDFPKYTVGGRWGDFDEKKKKKKNNNNNNNKSSSWGEGASTSGKGGSGIGFVELVDKDGNVPEGVDRSGGSNGAGRGKSDVMARQYAHSEVQFEELVPQR